MFEGEGILGFILFAQIAPIACQVALKVGKQVNAILCQL